jgi:hypothetical protein
MDDPFEGARREASLPNLWYCKVPGTYEPKTQSAVVCAFTIDEPSRTVTCESFATLGLPL